MLATQYAVTYKKSNPVYNLHYYKRHNKHNAEYNENLKTLDKMLRHTHIHKHLL